MSEERMVIAVQMNEAVAFAAPMPIPEFVDWIERVLSVMDGGDGKDAKHLVGGSYRVHYADDPDAADWTAPQAEAPNALTRAVWEGTIDALLRGPKNGS